MERSVLLFYGKSSAFSNFTRSPFILGGESYVCVEQSYQHSKSKHFKDYATAARIMATTSPFEHKRLGGSVSGFKADEWSKVSYDVMKKALRAKFQQNPGQREKLLQSAGNILAEASGTDQIWGIGLYESHPSAREPSLWRGMNLLGQALMEVRDEMSVEGAIKSLYGN